MIAINKLTSIVPLGIGINGRLQARALNLFDKLLPAKIGMFEIGEGIRVDTSENSERLLRYFLYNVLRYYRASPLFRFMQKMLKDDDIFLDIGANLGMYSYLAKKLQCQSYAFEPEPAHVEFLKRNPSIYDRLFTVAASDSDGECDFFVAGKINPGGSSLVAGSAALRNSMYARTVKVKTQRIDAAITDANVIERIKLAKIDVEGAEELVVSGMTGLLKKNPFAIWCEVRGPQSSRNPNSCQKVIDILAPLGYHAYVFEGRSLEVFSDRHVQQVFDLIFLQNKSGNIA
ncbi:MAG: FkbM family methyltransferase [Verrucomicrobiaceae bacterium]|nr:FkbM family methyltransferase [Verrucomicrobiaceae bacterium]